MTIIGALTMNPTIPKESTEPPDRDLWEKWLKEMEEEKKDGK